MNSSRPGGRWSDEQGLEVRTDDGNRNMPVPQNYSTHPLSLSPEPADPRLQARKGMAIRPFRFRAMDPRPHQNRREFLNTGHPHVCR